MKGRKERRTGYPAWMAVKSGGLPVRLANELLAAGITTREQAVEIVLTHRRGLVDGPNRPLVNFGSKSYAALCTMLEIPADVPAHQRVVCNFPPKNEDR